MTEKIKSYIIFVLLSVVCILFLFHGCKQDPVVKAQEKAIHDTIVVEKQKIVYQEKEVVKWKEAAAGIHYRTTFDSTATIDTVKVELTKADTLVKIEAKEIAIQDSIDIEKDTIQAQEEKEVELVKKELKKEKGKVFLAKVVAVIATVLLVLKVIAVF